MRESAGTRLPPFASKNVPCGSRCGYRLESNSHRSSARHEQSAGGHEGGTEEARGGGGRGTIAPRTRRKERGKAQGRYARSRNAVQSIVSWSERHALEASNMYTNHMRRGDGLLSVDRAECPPRYGVGSATQARATAFNTTAHVRLFFTTQDTSQAGTSIG